MSGGRACYRAVGPPGRPEIKMANPEVLLPTIVGRSSSHFTRTVRMFALELQVVHTFQVWLDSRLPQILAGLPATRDLSYLEVTLFCLTTHLGFRDILPTAGYGNLTEFCTAFATRASAAATPYQFDS
jgi:hypothetical protein